MVRTIALLLLTMTVSACGSSSGNSDSNNNSSANNQDFTPLIQDSLEHIDSVEFFHLGGFVGPGVLPFHKLTIVYNPTTQAAVATHSVTQGSTTNQCSASLNLATISVYINNMVNSYLALDGSPGQVVDAGDDYFVFNLKNGTSQEYIFQGGDSSHLAIVIFGQALQTQLRSILQSIPCSI